MRTTIIAVALALVATPAAAGCVQKMPGYSECSFADQFPVTTPAPIIATRAQEAVASFAAYQDLCRQPLPDAVASKALALFEAQQMASDYSAMAEIVERKKVMFTNDGLGNLGKQAYCHALKADVERYINALGS